ncbi:methylenetetrahydrofolate reductase [Campylobacter geochelonis]|uniref:Methylenetetrahydrofolate reductase n=1 Tax=Campylobacter geochelonis TaxID=1780362 RepID=A0A128ECP5_9BACT|nr:methylenetetrahydrofolate reductase [Campylobacter geochelonis]QKF70644.1 methylenetetrahydrofolate reductase family protein [Campylobacter geochelonis]CZE45871.1 DNA-binding protein II [Campylobacter geochelonis]CZE46766.1 DNA-binding protein II [Campylobacter geochelonis]CZE50314.1 DNA-binding protein II [Campylobacter geochelonis]
MLIEKLKSNQAGILLYGLTPPKSNLDNDEIKRISSLQKDRINSLQIDGIILYDLQDESARTSQKRTFEFIHTIDPYVYYTDFLHVTKPAIIYRAVGKYKSDEFSDVLTRCKGSNFATVFVGASSKNQNVNLKLDEAYRIKERIAPNLALGGICIPERHASKANEHLKVASKTSQGCEFFITQAVYNVENAKNFIDDYAKMGVKKVPIIFTFTPCGSLKTLEFMKWLGISVPPFLETRLKNSVDILQSSVSLSLEMFEFLYKYSQAKGVSIGANVESISTRKVEIQASIELLNGIKKIIDKKF